MKRVILILTSLILLSSCSVEKRLQRLLRHHPELIDTTSILIKDTITISSVKDSISFKDSTVIDTVFNTKDSIKIHIIKKEGIVRIKYEVKEKKIPYIKTITNTVNISKSTIDKIEDKYKTKIERRNKTIWILAILSILEGLIIYLYVKKNITKIQITNTKDG